ncbi:MAG: nodulation protein NfeD [Chloroflexi bacterium]|nr:nodulation protein NfeD [Chloroflexota bacterium]
MLRRGLLFSLALGLLAMALLPWKAAHGDSPVVVVLQVKGIITPVLADYVERGIAIAESRGAVATVIQLDTPGGLDEAMRDIIQHIVNAPMPVVVYVSPAGARAASAGAFITIAGHVAAMAPGTGIGAAHPVALGQGGEQQVSSTMELKVLNDAVAYIKSLAEMRGRNVEWAESAVRQSASVQASEALRLGVVDVVAPDLPSLLKEIHGRKVKLLTREVVLQTQGARILPVNMSQAESFLLTISNPNIAFILLSLAMLALFFELANPGAVFPGVVGGILLLTALYSVGTLPVNWAGLLLIALAFILFVSEVFVTSHGVLAMGGVVALILGGLLLISTSAPPNLQVDRRLIAGVASVVVLYFVFVIRAIVRARLRRPTVGTEDLIGKTAVARTPLRPEGMVFIGGERWTATCEDALVEEGEEVVVRAVEGLRLRVGKKERG